MRSEVLLKIQTLHHVANAALVDTPIAEVLETTANEIASLLPADRVSIIGFNVDKKSVDYFVEGGKGRDHVVTSVSYQELWEGLSGWVLKEGAPALSSKSEPDPRESAEVQARRAATHCGSILVVPVRNHEKYLATITAINLPEERDFGSADVELLMLAGISIAVLIENAKLVADLQLARDLAEVSRTRLAEQNEMKDKLFTILAHDLRGPVGNLSMLLSVAAESELSNAELNEILLEGHRSAAGTYNLLDNLLGWVRSQLDEVRVLSTRFLVRKSLVPVKLLLEPQAKAKGIAITLDGPADLTVAADERMFETIIRNFVSNAVKYSREHTVITMRAQSRGETVVIEVLDQGEGIDAATLAGLLSRRSGESVTGTAGERGSGLGLMFCGDLARRLGGRIEAESEPSVGSVFRLVLPDPVDEEL